MKQSDFNDKYEYLTRSQKKVLKEFLAGNSDEQIVEYLKFTDRSTVSKHLNQICIHFGLKNQDDRRSRCRPELVELFAEYKPDLVNSEVLKRFNCQTPARGELEFPEGPLALDSSFYVERPSIESKCYEAIMQPGALIRIKAPKQMGKTSLLYRILHSAAKQGTSRTVELDLREADESVLSSLERFLRWFCAQVGRKLGLTNRLAEYWDEDLSSNSNCTAYFEEYLLAEIDSPLTLGLDEFDRIFPYPKIAEDFFGLLRTWHNYAANHDIWRRLRLVLAHSTEVYIQFDINHSPFNVGLPIELLEFSREQVQDLAQRHGFNWADGKEAHALMGMVGGNPYLVRLALYHLGCKEIALEQLLQQAPTESGIYSDYLRRHLGELEDRPELRDAMRQVVIATRPVRLESKQAFQLLSRGLVQQKGNEVEPRCKLYCQYFRDRLDVK